MSDRSRYNWPHRMIGPSVLTSIHNIPDQSIFCLAFLPEPAFISFSGIWATVCQSWSPMSPVSGLLSLVLPWTHPTRAALIHSSRHYLFLHSNLIPLQKYILPLIWFESLTWFAFWEACTSKDKDLFPFIMLLGMCVWAKWVVLLNSILVMSLICRIKTQFVRHIPL